MGVVMGREGLGGNFSGCPSLYTGRSDLALTGVSDVT